MPKYDYHCDVCDQTFELKLPFGSSIHQDCPECDSAARRLLTPPALVFKGSGFYKTAERGESNSEQSNAPKETQSSATNSTDIGSNEPAKSKAPESIDKG
ncbi:MAG: FmdB family transcriptional regulator [Chloroflexi bacterium]|nr:FmdB family transcriptional regulator [Chloroflexota bacterium]|tara:strand:- start:3 stop:302 length:300 start_codon:yes stop_codon:yes gene_type:complete